MQAGPLIFIAIAILIGAAGFFVSRLFRRNIDRDLPGSRESGAGTHWYADPPDEDN
ncbi:hypothetical protein [Oricola sp.]|uniref:hypothetical protein n=1 Tax=Oricola sp. TaxID=1979950 RepID=UPI0026A0C978|tara:strand:- start:27509 stop:27676 length:168 start_codon:yes stop_codon:yes gene_type:complete